MGWGYVKKLCATGKLGVLSSRIVLLAPKAWAYDTQRFQDLAMPTRRSILASLLFTALAPFAAAQGPAPKVLHMFLSTSETGMDPAVASDIATLSLLENLFDPLLRYDYLARPVKLQGNGAKDLPEISADGLTYTFHIRPGMRFTPDPAFKGPPREVTAADYVYSIQRLYDPTLKSPWSFMFEGKLLGDAAWKDRFSYATSIPGLQAVDRYTLRVRLSEPDNNFLFYLATPATGVVAREVIEAYPGQAGNHPVGTGPFMLGTGSAATASSSSRIPRRRPCFTPAWRWIRRPIPATVPSRAPSKGRSCRAWTRSTSRSRKNSRAACWAS